MKRFWLSIMAVMLVVAFSAPAFAWDFSMTGEYEYRYRYFSRIGTKDLFGDAQGIDDPNYNYNTAGSGQPVYLGLAGPNIYNLNLSTGNAAGSWVGGSSVAQDNAVLAGVAIRRGGFSRWNVDAVYGDQRVTFAPTFRVNNAIRVFGVYNIGGIRNKYVQRATDATGNYSAGTAPFERYYMMDEGLSAYNTGGIGSWEQIRATIQLPILTLSIGKKDFVFGNGAVYAQNVPTDSFMIIAPYGPFRFLGGSYPAHGNSLISTAAGAAQNTNSWDIRPDLGTKYGWRYPFGMTYDNGPMTMGMLWIPMMSHINIGDSGRAFNQDVCDHTFMAFMKYTNGRFFLNVDWWTRDTTVHRIKRFNSPAGAEVLGDFAPSYNEGYIFWSEAGVLAGPAKLSLMYASASGPVLNNFGAASNNDFRQTKTYGGGFAAVNYQALEPYSFLMFPTYGGGNNTFNADGNGQMSDAFAFAGRLDYAVAANLNIWGSYLWAHRLEQAGTYAGSYSSSGSYVPPTTNMTRVTTAQQFKGVAQGPGGGNPYVDDGLIGWEAQLGVDWKLLEGLNASAAYSYWNLGEWFDQAYQAFTPAGANGGGLVGNQGQGYMKGRDPIQSLRGSLVINF